MKAVVEEQARETPQRICSSYRRITEVHMEIFGLQWDVIGNFPFNASPGRPTDPRVYARTREHAGRGRRSCQIVGGPFSSVCSTARAVKKDVWRHEPTSSDTRRSEPLQSVACCRGRWNETGASRKHGCTRARDPAALGVRFDAQYPGS